jgi:hypothetical protein
MAVLVVGCHDSGKRALIRALLRAVTELVDVSPASYLVMRYGPTGEPLAHVPGCRRPLAYGPGRDRGSGGTGGMADAGSADAGDAAQARPPRRVELTLPDPLLRHFSLIDSPCAHRLGTAGGLVLADAAERGGAVVFVATAGRQLTRSELDLLGELASREVSVFFAIAPAAAQVAHPVSGADLGPEAGLDEAANASEQGSDPVMLALDEHRSVVAGHAPELADAPWFAVDPVAGDTAYLRRALVEWAGVEGLRRASDNPPVLPVAGAARVGAEAGASGWLAALDEWLVDSGRTVRQRLAIEVANVHLRCVRDLLFGGGCAGLPETLDHEMQALSQRATAECDTVVATIVHDVLRRVMGGEPAEDVRRRVVAAVRRVLAEDAHGGGLARVLLVTSAGGVAAVSGRDALVALPGYAPENTPSILPPVGLAVAGGCYALWHAPDNDDVARARSWLQRGTRAVELELLREVDRRLDAVHRSLGALIGETIDRGILLA